MAVDINFIMRFEDGADDLTSVEIIDAFSDLIKTGAIRGLQGFYGRFARDLIDSGWIDQDGNVLDYPDPEFD